MHIYIYIMYIFIYLIRIYYKPMKYIKGPQYRPPFLSKKLRGGAVNRAELFFPDH